MAQYCADGFSSAVDVLRQDAGLEYWIELEAWEAGSLGFSLRDPFTSKPEG